MAEYHFDVVFIDCSASQPYDRKSLENKPLGGVESSVIRVAEGLGALGISVAVVKASDESAQIHHQEFEPIMGQFAYFMHEKELDKMAARYLVCLRGPMHLDRLGSFNKIPTQKFVWCHDLASENIQYWRPSLIRNNATVVAVSEWHKNQIKQHLDYDKITAIYNPVDESLYSYKRDKVNRDLMVWASSPHKGLDKALGTFKKIHEQLPNLRLLIYNPGYIRGDVVINPGALYYGPTTLRNVWLNIKNALCLYYATDFQETFGLVQAEANAIGCPVLGYNTGALPETINDSFQLTEPGNEAHLINRLCQWYHGEEPQIKGRNEFRLNSVLTKWLRLFGGLH